MSRARLSSLLVSVALVATGCIAYAWTPASAWSGAPRAISHFIYKTPSGPSETPTQFDTNLGLETWLFDDMARDSSGNTYVTLEAQGANGTWNIGVDSSFTSAPGASRCRYLAKLDTNGEALWARKLDCGNSTTVYNTRLAIDGSDNVYTAFLYGGTPTFGTTTLPAPPSGGVGSDKYGTAIVKWNPSGTAQWAVTPVAYSATAPSGGYGWNSPIGLEYADNSIFFAIQTVGTGFSDGSTDFDTGAETLEPILGRLSLSDGSTTWTKEANVGATRKGRLTAYGLAVKDDGSAVYMTGSASNASNYSSASIGWESTNMSLDSDEWSQVFVAAFDGDGAISWVKDHGLKESSGADYTFDGGRAITVNSAGDLMLTAFFAKDAVVGSTTIAANGDYLVKVSPTDGTASWSVSLRTDNDRVYPEPWAASNGSVWVPGVLESYSGTASVTIGSTTISVPQGSKKSYIVNVSSAGSITNVITFTGSDSEVISLVRLDSAGNLVFVGLGKGLGACSTTNSKPAYHAYAFIAKMDPATGCFGVGSANLLTTTTSTTTTTTSSTTTTSTTSTTSTTIAGGGSGGGSGSTSTTIAGGSGGSGSGGSGSGGSGGSGSGGSGSGGSGGSGSGGSGSGSSIKIPTGGMWIQGVIFSAIPRRAGVGALLPVIHSSRGKTVTYSSQTPDVCEGGGRYLLLLMPGKCRVNVYTSGRLIRRISLTVLWQGVAEGSEIVETETLLFNPNASKVTKVAKAKMAEFVGAASKAKVLVVMGFAANDGGRLGSGYSRYLSMRRAQKVAAHLESIGVRVDNVSWHANLVPASKRNLRLNRRVVVAWVSP